MIDPEKLSITVKERLGQLNETPASLGSNFGDNVLDPASWKFPADYVEKLVSDAIAQKLGRPSHAVVRQLEQMLGFSEFTLFAFSSDGRGIPEFGENIEGDER